MSNRLSNRTTRRMIVATLTAASAIVMSAPSATAQGRRGESVQACYQGYTNGYHGQQQNSYGHFGNSSSNFNYCP
jgi:hypothetical protein